jgi:hypothetical protein
MSVDKFIVCILLLAIDADGSKILFYAPQIGDSHSTFLGKIADTLVEAGHDVVGSESSLIKNGFHIIYEPRKNFFIIL